MRVIKTTALVAASLCGLTLLSACNAEEPGKNIAVVNGVPISQARADFVAKMQTQQGAKDTPEFRKQLRDVLVTREIIAQEAMRQGLDKSEDYQVQMDMARQQLLVNAFLEDYLKKHEPTEAQLRAEYDRVKAEQADPNAKEIKARHILVKKEAEAKAILAQLKKGAKFEDIARKKSEDTGSKNKGGELDWTDGNNMVKPFAEAMRALKKGETTEKPVQTQYGFHIIRVDDVRAVTFPAFEDVKDQVSKQFIAKQRDQMVEELKKGARIE